MTKICDKGIQEAELLTTLNDNIFNLRTENESLKKENGSLKNEYGLLKNENANLKNEIKALEKQLLSEKDRNMVHLPLSLSTAINYLFVVGTEIAS